ncbi:MAG: ribosomal protein [Verrucomicrobia bacterium]|nr:ribosomal protein [Verrucomicrobiota bacterium]
MFNFERLVVRSKGIALADRVYAVTKSFSAEERFGLTSQMRRASVSISSNVAEGSSQYSRNDYRRFIEITARSTFELVSRAAVARNQGLLTPKSYVEIYDQALEIVRMLSGLRDSLGD